MKTEDDTFSFNFSAPLFGCGNSSSTLQTVTPSQTPDVSLTNVDYPSVLTSSMTSSRSCSLDLPSAEGS